MDLKRFLRGAVVLGSCLGVLFAAAQPAAAEYIDGSFLGVVTDSGGTATFTAPAAGLFPQVSTWDVPLAGDTTVTVSNGVELDIFLSLQSGEGTHVMPGTMRYTLYQANDATRGHLVNLVGTFTLNTENDSGPYEISGPVIGDQQSLYLVGQDTSGTESAGDDVTFQIRVGAAGMGGLDPSRPAYIAGAAQVLLGGPLTRTMTEAISATAFESGVTRALAGVGFGSGTTFNQIVPADGGGDIPVGLATPGLFVANVNRAGTIGGAGNLNIFGNALLLGNDASAVGLFLSRLNHTFPDGKSLQGFIVGDFGQADSGIRQAEGFIFSLMTPDPAPTLLFGTFTGNLAVNQNSNVLTLAPAAAYWATDSTPPELWFGGSPDLTTSGYQTVWTAARDLNGSGDIKTLSLLINDSRASNRIYARYLADKNRLYLYNKALKTWVGNCDPGTTKIVKTPWGSLNCKDTAVGRIGEYLFVGWNLKPTAKMLGTWNVFLKADDRSGQVVGWRHFRELSVKP